MTFFQNIREQTEQKITVSLLSEIESNPAFTQRSLANSFDIALGLANQYLKKCVKKGWVRVTKVSPRRITYFLTPKGLKEKSAMVANYLAKSFAFFREARAQCEEIFTRCKENGWLNIALFGGGDLADIAKLVAHVSGINVDLITNVDECGKFDAILITDVVNPQKLYDMVKEKNGNKNLLVPRLLHIALKKIPNEL